MHTPPNSYTIDVAKDEIFIANYENTPTEITYCVILLSSALRDIGDVLKRANATRYGLAAGVFTRSMDTANTLSRGLKVGTVWINCYDVFDAAIPFGGYKMSGIGREKGVYSLNNYLQIKAIVSPLKNPAWL